MKGIKRPAYEVGGQQQQTIPSYLINLNPVSLKLDISIFVTMPGEIFSVSVTQPEKKNLLT